MTQPLLCRVPTPSIRGLAGRGSMIAMALWAGLFSTAPVLAHSAGLCTKTANAALLACQHEAKDDYWIAIGNCNNLGDFAARAACVEQARAALPEGREDCAAQHEARQAVCESVGEAPYDPVVDPGRFVDPAEIGKSIAPNPYFPLVRGRSWVYRGGSEKITDTVLSETREILGVHCAVVHDLVTDEGDVVEDTLDWYAQDVDGNVWYFGEISQEFEDGQLVGIEGSWVAGVDGAKPGIVMKAHPVRGETYRQEFFLGDAEDVAQVLRLNGSATVPAAACSGNCLITQDFTPIEPDALEHKYYAPGIGLILEVNPATGERTELVRIRH